MKRPIRHAPEIWPVIVPSLLQNKTRVQAITALAAGGEDVLPVLETAQHGNEAGVLLLRGAAAVYGRVGGPRAEALLLELASHPDATVRHQALLALAASSFQAGAQDRETVEAQLALERRLLLATLATQVDLADEKPVDMAAGALEQQHRLQVDNLLLLLSFLYDPQVVHSARGAAATARA